MQDGTSYEKKQVCSVIHESSESLQYLLNVHFFLNKIIIQQMHNIVSIYKLFIYLLEFCVDWL